MKTLSLKTKIRLIATVCILAVGIALTCIFGFNNTAKNKNGYELSVKAEANIGSVSNVIKDTTESYLKNKGVCASSVTSYDDGGQYVFNFSKDYIDAIDTAELADAVKTEFNKDEILSGLDVTVKYNQTVNAIYSQPALKMAFALILTAAAIFVYTLITEKSLAAALGVLCPSVVSALLFFACVGLTRIPAGDFFTAGFAVSIVLTAAFSFVLTNRFKEEIRLAQSNKPDYALITKTGTEKGVFRICISAGIAAAFGILTFAFGISGDLKWAGLQLIIAAAVSAFSSLSFTGLIYKEIKCSGKGEKAAAKEEEN